MADKIINGRHFRTEPMLASAANILLARIMKMVGPGLAGLGEALKQRAENQDDAFTGMAAFSAISNIFQNSTPEELSQLIVDVCELAEIKRDGKNYETVIFDQDFTGHQKDQVPLVMFVLREQFGDFFGAIPGIGKLGKKAVN